MPRSSRRTGPEGGQAAVLEAARRWGESEPRVRAVLVKGSLGRGTADALSDVDLVIVSQLGQREGLWQDRKALAEALGPPLALFKEAPWHRPYLAIAVYEGPLKVDLFFEEGEVPPDQWLGEGFLTLLDRGGVESRLRERLAAFQPPSFRAEDLAELDGQAWDWAWWLWVKLARGERWLVYVELAKFFETIVVPAYNALAGEPRAGYYALDRRLSPSLIEELEAALPRRVTPRALHHSLLALVDLYARARARLRRRLTASLSDRLMRQVRRRIRTFPPGGR